MSELARKLFEGLKTAKQITLAIAPGLENVGSDLQREGSRLATQGAMELSSALFNGHAFVPYGPGQYTPAREQLPELDQTHPAEHEHSGMER
ncbi:MAG TPA: hypothetical protein VGN12_19445 [Pirellulales bacterium]|jgi:hypothetical protein